MSTPSKAAMKAAEEIAVEERRLASVAHETAADYEKDLTKAETELASLRAENEKLKSHLHEWDTALSENSEYEGDDAPWQTMRDEFNALREKVKVAVVAANFVVNEWIDQSGRVYEAMGSDNQRARAIDSAVARLQTALAQLEDK